MGKFLIFSRIKLKFCFWLYEKCWQFQFEKKRVIKKLSPKSLWQTYMKWTVSETMLRISTFKTQSANVNFSIKAYERKLNPSICTATSYTNHLQHYKCGQYKGWCLYTFLSLKIEIAIKHLIGQTFKHQAYDWSVSFQINQ